MAIRRRIDKERRKNGEEPLAREVLAVNATSPSLKHAVAMRKKIMRKMDKETYEQRSPEQVARMIEEEKSKRRKRRKKK